MDTVKRLASTNIEVYPIGLGAMPLSLHERPSITHAHSVIEAFINNGGNFIDTANVYCSDGIDIGHNETLIANTLSKLHSKKNILVATKGGVRRNNNNWIVDGDPDFIRKSCVQSLKDLQTDSIFLYQLHAPDPEVPLTDTVGELLKLGLH